MLTITARRSEKNRERKHREADRSRVVAQTFACESAPRFLVAIRVNQSLSIATNCGNALFIMTFRRGLIMPSDNDRLPRLIQRLNIYLHSGSSFALLKGYSRFIRLSSPGGAFLRHERRSRDCKGSRTLSYTCTAMEAFGSRFRSVH